MLYVLNVCCGSFVHFFAFLSANCFRNFVGLLGSSGSFGSTIPGSTGLPCFILFLFSSGVKSEEKEQGRLMCVWIDFCSVSAGFCGVLSLCGPAYEVSHIIERVLCLSRFLPTKDLPCTHSTLSLERVCSCLSSPRTTSFPTEDTILCSTGEAQSKKGTRSGEWKRQFTQLEWTLACGSAWMRVPDGKTADKINAL